MAIDFNKPATTDNYSTGFVPNIQNALKALGQLLDPAVAGTISNPVTGLHRLNSAAAGGGIFEWYNGSAWAERTMAYAKLAGATFTGALITVASASGAAGFRLPHGAAPSAPVNGDVWTTTAAVLARMNGATKTVAFTDSNITGNAATATKLAAAVNINGVAFDGSAAITVADATKLPLAGGTLTGGLTGTSATFSGAGSFGSLVGGTVFASAASSGDIRMRPGDATHTGYLEFVAANGNRQGYAGYSTGTAAGDSGTINYVGGTHAFTGSLTSNGRFYGAGSANGWGGITLTTTTGTPATAPADGEFVFVY